MATRPNTQPIPSRRGMIQAKVRTQLFVELLPQLPEPTARQTCGTAQQCSSAVVYACVLIRTWWDTQHRRLRWGVSTRTRAHTHTHMHTYTHKHMHTHTNTKHTHTHTERKKKERESEKERKRDRERDTPACTHAYSTHVYRP